MKVPHGTAVTQDVAGLLIRILVLVPSPSLA